MKYSWDDFELDVDRFELRCAGDRVPMEPQVFETLAYLVQNGGRVVSKDELIEHIWPDKFISESALTSRLMAARKALGDTGREQRYIRTVHGRGYSFLTDVIQTEDGRWSRAVSGMDEPEAAHQPAESGPLTPARIQYTRTSDGLNLAYSVTGQGIPLIRVLGWFTHLELEWQWAAGRRFWERLGERHRLVRYDGRGMGLSDPAERFSMETRLRDLEAVVEATGFERFAIVGMSEGSWAAVHYAAAHPDRVSHLICYGGGIAADRNEWKAWLKQWESLLGIMRLGWGQDSPVYRQFFAQLFLGSNARPDDIRYFNAMQTAATSAEQAANYLLSADERGVDEAARQVRVPTLVVHRREDVLIPYSRSRRLAQLIPGAELLLLEGENHWLLLDDPGAPAFVQAVEEFTGAASHATSRPQPVPGVGSAGPATEG